MFVCVPVVCVPLVPVVPVVCVPEVPKTIRVHIYPYIKLYLPAAAAPPAAAPPAKAAPPVELVPDQYFIRIIKYLIEPGVVPPVVGVVVPKCAMFSF